MTKIDRQKYPLFATYYQSDGYSISGKKLMGRQAAGRSYLSAIANSSVDSIPVMVTSNNSIEILKKDLSDILPNNTTKQADIFFRHKPKNIEKYGGVFVPGPDISDFARQRMYYGHDKYSLLGVTHTTASQHVMDGLSSLLTHPVMPWDAIICTSNCVHDTVTKVINSQKDYLKSKLDAKNFSLPQFPIIPLGVDPDYFEINESNKSSARKKLNIDQDDIAIIFVGRLSFHAKSHPFPMYLALEKIQQNLPKDKKIHLIQTGWFANDHIKNAFENEAKKICPNINLIFLDGRDQSLKFQSLAASDIFVSLSDNIQETFGLTPLEGMASGLPVVATDWNGYRDTVRDNKDGFLVPTYTLPEGNLEEIAYDHMSEAINYDYYIGINSLYTAVDIQKCISSLKELILNDELRLKMGKEARNHAKSNYYWPIILEKYKELFIELDNIREIESKNFNKLENFILPSSNLDPSYIFGKYPTVQISETDSFEINKLHEVEIEDIFNFDSVNYVNHLLPDIETIEAVYNALKTKKTLKEINKSINNLELVLKSAAWLMKFGFISIR